VRVNDGELATLVDLRKERVERCVSQIEPTRVARQLDPSGTQLVHGADRLGAGRVHVRQWQHGAKREAPGMASDDFGRPVVEPAAEGGRFGGITKERLR
jgi:hypothetical protein